MALLACVLGLAVNVAAQTPAPKPQFATLLAALHSEKWQDRAVAFEQLRNDPKAMSDKTVKAALVDLQDRENHLTEATAPDKDSEEAFAEYLGALASVLFNVADWDNAHDLCILAHGVYNTDSKWAAKLAASRQNVVPCLMQMAVSKWPDDRFRSVAVLIQIRARGQDLDSGTTEKIRDITIHALHDADEGVRTFTADALGKFGGADMIPALQQVAQTDPAPAVQGNSVRTIARQAIAAIQKRNN